MGATFTIFGSAKEKILDGTIDLMAESLKVMLVTSVYVPDLAHEVLADVLTSPDPEVVAIASPSNGYTAGGQELTGKAVSKTTSPPNAFFDAADLVWTDLTATFRYGILYVDGPVGSPAIQSPLIGYILFDDAPADVIVAGVPWTLQWHPSGILKV